jgi:hypothetical protein
LSASKKIGFFKIKLKVILRHSVNNKMSLSLFYSLECLLAVSDMKFCIINPFFNSLSLAFIKLLKIKVASFLTAYSSSKLFLKF